MQDAMWRLLMLCNVCLHSKNYNKVGLFLLPCIVGCQNQERGNLGHQFINNNDI